MGQKTNPIGNRLGYIRGWESNWYGGKDFGDKLAEDDKIRKYINIRLARASVSRIPIERTMKMITVTIHTARPGIIIGKGGQEVETLKAELKKLTKKDVQAIYIAKKLNVKNFALSFAKNKNDVLRLMVLLSFSDKEFHENEEEMIKKLSLKHDLPSEKIDLIFEDIKNSDENFVDMCLETLEKIQDEDTRKQL